MFTGIIESKAKIISQNNGYFTIVSPFPTHELSLGQSVSHDGACMTVESIDHQNNAYTFFAMEESLAKTNFSQKNTGDYFNVERCLQVGARLDGHFVQGHVDTVGICQEVQVLPDGSKKLCFSFPKKFQGLLIEKGSIAINGVSLTLVHVTNETFCVYLIPLTQTLTNLGDMQQGQSVNIEFDMIGKYIVRNHG